MKNIKLSWYPFTLELKHPFTISVNSRTTTPVVLVEIKYEGMIGYGEASLPPYLSETQESVQSFLSKIDLSVYDDITNLSSILSGIDKLSPGNNAAKASVDIALHDLVGKIKGIPVYQMYDIPKLEMSSSFTIGIDSPEILIQKLHEADKFKYIKVKLGSHNDKKIIETIRDHTSKPLFVDVNQGWNNREVALDFALWLKSKNVLLIEQPFIASNINDTRWLKERSPIPVIADEAVRRLSDLDKIKDAYSGINIKLMKSTGILEAFKMINRAREMNLNVMLGCMTETSCAISAAAQLSSLADWVDLDGNILIKNDRFCGVNSLNGNVIPNDLPGLGIQKII
ncbi:MAG: dipeptide epimerase [Ignavibacteriaceae bacterium]|nr:dipeptide epimerase [Ignavibacteriaceae bacterium]